MGSLKKFVISFLLMIIMFIPVTTINAAAVTSFEFIAKEVKKAPKIDGIKDNEWDGVSKVTLDKNNGTSWTDGIINTTAEYYFMWDDDAFYGLVVVTGDNTIVST